MMKGAITTYNGKRYRSRTEARWAKFFDELQIKHWYEPQKFDFGDYRYIPDFYLPLLKAWVEIKANAYGEEHIAKIKSLAERTGERAFLFKDYDISPSTGTPYAYGYIYRDGALYGDHVFTWAKCPVCGAFDISHMGWASALACGCCSGWGSVYADDAREIIRAYNRAVQIK